MLYGAPRSAAIKTVGKCELWGIDRMTFKKVVQEITEKVFEENRKFIEEIDFFSKTTEEILLWEVVRDLCRDHVNRIKGSNCRSHDL